MSTTPVFTQDVSLYIASINSRPEPVTINCSYIPGFLLDSSYAISNESNAISSEYYQNTIVTTRDNLNSSYVYNISSSIAIDNSNNIYFSAGSLTQNLGVIYIYINETKEVITITTDYQNKNFASPSSLAIDNTNNYFYVLTGFSQLGDRYSGFQYKINTIKTDSTLITYRQSLNMYNLTGKTFSGITTDSIGNLYIADIFNLSTSLYYYDYNDQLKNIQSTPVPSHSIHYTPLSGIDYSNYKTYGIAIDNTNNYLYASFLSKSDPISTNYVIQYNLNNTAFILSNPLIIFSSDSSGYVTIPTLFPRTLSVDLSHNLYVNSQLSSNKSIIYLWNPSSTSTYKTAYIGEYDQPTGSSLNYLVSGITNDASDNLYFYLNNGSNGDFVYGIAKLNPNKYVDLSFNFSNLPLQIGYVNYNMIDTNTKTPIFSFNLYSGTITIDNPSYYTGRSTIKIYYKDGMPNLSDSYTLKDSVGNILSTQIPASKDYIFFPNVNLLGPTETYYFYDNNILLSKFYQDYNPLIVGQNGSLSYYNSSLTNGNYYILIDASYGYIVSEYKQANSNSLYFNAVNLLLSGSRNYYIYNYDTSINAPTTNTNLTLTLNGTKINTYPQTIYSNSSFCIYFKNSSLFINGGLYTLNSFKLSAPVTATATYDSAKNNILVFQNLSVDPGPGTYTIFYNDINNDFPGLGALFPILTFNLNALPIISGTLAEIAYQSTTFSDGISYALTESNGTTIISDIVTYYSNSYTNLTFTCVNIQTSSASIAYYNIVNKSNNIPIIQNIQISVGTIQANQNPVICASQNNQPTIQNLIFSHPAIYFSNSLNYNINYNNNNFSINETIIDINTINFSYVYLLRGYYLYNIVNNATIITSFYFNAIVLINNQPCKYILSNLPSDKISPGNTYDLILHDSSEINISNGTSSVCDSNYTIFFKNLIISTQDKNLLNDSRAFTLVNTNDPNTYLIDWVITFDLPGTLITSPTPLIQQQPGSITFYGDLSYNNCPINSNKYFLQLVNTNGSVSNLSTFINSPTSEITSNYQTVTTTPQAITFDLFGNLYITDISSNYITAFNPNFQQYYQTRSIVSPYGMKFNSASGLLFITCLGVCDTASIYGAIYSMTPPNYTYNSNEPAIFSPVFQFQTQINNTPLDNLYSIYCKYPYDIEFDASGNMLVSNFGSYTNGSTSTGFISKLFLQNGSVVDAAVIISSVSSNTTTSALGDTISSLGDASLNYPSGMAYDLSNNYLYVANVTSITFNAGSITAYNMNTLQKLGSFQTSFVGNTNVCPNFGTNNIKRPVTSLKLDNYGNLYYLYFDTINTYVNVVKPGNNINTGIFQAPLVYSHMIINITDNSSYGLTFKNGNIFVSGNVITNTTSILEIQTAYQFNNVVLNSGNNQLQIVNATNNNPVGYLNVNVPSSNLFVTNTTSYTNQAAIVSYYDNPNNANTCLPKGGYTYQFLNNANASNYVNVLINDNNEEVYANYQNELGALSFPISMDFDNSGNLYVLNAPSTTLSNTTFLSIITPHSGNLGKTYKSNISLINPSVIRYNSNDNCMYLGVYGSNSYGSIYKVITTQGTNGIITRYNVKLEFFYADNTFCFSPIDIVFDTSIRGFGLGASTTGNMYISNYGNATISKIPLIYKATIYPPVTSTIVSNIASPITLVNSSYLSPYLSGIAVDASYVYIINTPNTASNNILANIGQFSNTSPNTLIQYWNAGYVGKLVGESHSPIQLVSSTLKFDQYGNLFYIYSYIPSGTGSTTPIINVQAFVPSSGSGTPIYTHTMSTNPTSQIYGISLYGGDIYVAQYQTNTIVKIINTFSFGNYGFGVSGSQSSLILPSQTNSYSILGGNVPITNITIGANILNHTFNTATIVTTPSPLIANTPGTLYYYNNPGTTSPDPNTSYNLLNSSNKVVSNTYTTTPGNETTLIYIGLSQPSCITADNQGYLYIANAGIANSNYPNGSITKCTSDGQIIYTIVNSNILNPYAIKFNPVDGYIYYTNTSPINIGTNVYFYIYKMSTDGSTFTQVYQDSNYNYLYNPHDLCFDSGGNIYVSNNYTTTSSGSVVNGSISKISITYPSGVATLAGTLTISNYLTGLTRNTAGYVSVSGIAIDTISDYLYVVTGTNETNHNNINISQIPLTGNDAGCVCRKWQTGQVGNANGQTSLSFDPFGNLYYYYYYSHQGTNTCSLNAFNPYTNETFTYAHNLLGGAISGAYGVLYNNGNLYSTQSALSISSGNYINNLVEINTSYYFTGVTLQAGNNVVAINDINTGKIIIDNIQIYVPYAKYYTIPAPPVAGQPAQLFFDYSGVVMPVLNHQYVVVDTNMNHVSGIFTDTDPNVTTFVFQNLILPGGANYLYIFDITTGQIVPGTNMFIKIPIVCFYKGTKILCAINGKETYVPIEKIGQGTLVKTYKHGFKKVKYNIKGKLNNTSEHNIDKLFKLSKKRFPELTEDLYVTGSHALLHDSLTPRDAILMRKVIEYAAVHYKSVYHAKIEDKFKLLAYHDERFEEIMQNAVFEIYHIVLENEDQCYNYGIYANGILAESTDELTLMRMKGFEKINKTSEKMEQFLLEMNKTKYPSQVRRALRNN